MKKSQKKQTAEQRFNEAFIKDVINAVKHNNAPWQKSWDTGEITAPYNAKSNRIYSGRNIIRLALTAQQKGYVDPRWATFKQIEELGGKVNKGEKGTGILFFKEEESVKRDGTPYTKKVIRQFHVFNLSQTDLPQYQQANKIDREVTPNLQPFADILERHDPKMQQGEPAYRPSNDTIYMPPKEAFKDDAYYYATALHEMSHWTGHESRLDRNIKNKFGSPEYAQEELVAELSSYMISLETGLPFNPTNSQAYLQHWGEKTGSELEESMMTAFKDASAVQMYLSGESREQVIAKKVSNVQQPKSENKEIQNFFKEVMYSEISNDEAKQALGIKEKVFLAVPYEERQNAKEAGAKWDKAHKAWYVYDMNDNPALKQYIPDFSATQGGATLEDFRIVAEQIGLDMSKADLESRGKQKRVPLQGKGSGNKSGEYKIFDNSDGTTGAYALNFVSGKKINWSNRTQNKLPQEIYGAGRAKSQQTSEIAVQIGAYIKEQRSQLAHKSYLGLEAVKGNEPYLVKKGIRNTHGLRRLDDNSVVVPLIDGHRITSLQVIKPDGEKRIMKQASKQGSYFPLGNRKNPSHVFIAEGVATAESVHQMVTPTYGDNVLVVAAIDSNNLPVVADITKKLYPNTEHFITADNDIHNEIKGLKNAGIEAANKVTQKYGDVQVLVPPVKDKGVDWNDYIAENGLKVATKELLSQVKAKTHEQEKNTEVEIMTDSTKKTFAIKNGNEEYPLNVQIFINNHYAGIGKFCKNQDEVMTYLKNEGFTEKEIQQKMAESKISNKEKLIDLKGMSPREAGRKLFDETKGNLGKIDLIKQSAQTAGFVIDEKKLQSANGKSKIEKADIFMKSISLMPKKMPKKQQENQLKTR